MAADVNRAEIIREVRDVLSVSQEHAEAIVQAFDDYVAKPLENNLSKLTGRDLARRNPMIYTARGSQRVEDWVDRVLEDKETSAIEGHIGTWMEEVARIISGGFKPGSGVDLQRDKPGEAATIEIYALQTAPNTKSAGGRRSDINALRQVGAVLRASKRQVELNIAVLSGRKRTSSLRADPNITLLGSDDFWEKVSGVRDFRARLIRATTILSRLIRKRATDEVARITSEAVALFGDPHGNLNLDALANPPPLPRKRGSSPA